MNTVLLWKTWSALLTTEQQRGKHYWRGVWRAGSTRSWENNPLDLAILYSNSWQSSCNWMDKVSLKIKPSLYDSVRYALSTQGKVNIKKIKISSSYPDAERCTLPKRWGIIHLILHKSCHSATYIFSKPTLNFWIWSALVCCYMTFKTDLL